MIDITSSSIVYSFLVANLLMIIFILVSKSKFLITVFSPGIFLFYIFSILLRLLFPLEFNFTTSLDSFVVVPKINNILFNNIIINDIYELSFSIFDFMFVVWLIGFFVEAVKLVKSYRSLYIFIRNSEQCQDTRLNSLLNKVKFIYGYKFKTVLHVGEKYATPFECGFIRQHIFLPDIYYTDEELISIFSHELTHHCNKTNWIKLVNNIIIIFFWWNPIIRSFHDSCEFILDIHCDSKAVEDKDEVGKINYLKNIYSIVKKTNNVFEKKSTINYFINPFENKETITKRFNIVYNRSREHKILRYYIQILFIMTVILSYKFVLQAAYMPDSTKMPDSLNMKEYEIDSFNGKQYVYKDGRAVIVSDKDSASLENIQTKDLTGKEAHK